MIATCERIELYVIRLASTGYCLKSGPDFCEAQKDIQTTVELNQESYV